MWTAYIMYPYEYQYEYECKYDNVYYLWGMSLLESNDLELIFEYLRWICMIGSVRRKRQIYMNMVWRIMEMDHVSIIRTTHSYYVNC